MTTSECVSFMSSPACNAVEIANHRGLRSPNCRSSCVTGVVSDVSRAAASRLYLLDIQHAWDRRNSLKPAWRKASNRSSCHDQALSILDASIKLAILTSEV